MRGLGIYNAAKFGVVGMTEALRADMEACGVGVSVLCPGVVSTSLGTSERNRPGHLSNVESGASAEGDATAAPAPGTDPLELAEQVLAAVLANQFWINTHPEFRPIVGQRHAAIEAAFADGADPVMVEAMSALVRPF
jgi:2-hydroxycyclohexanecarboxyl-CoA dehydrogenase